MFSSFPPAYAAWADRFEAPQAISPGAAVLPGQAGVGAEPELRFKGVGSINDVFVFEVGREPMTVEEMAAGKTAPKFVVRLSANAAAVRVPEGVLEAGRTYSWYVRSVHNPGTRSEAVKMSEILYFKVASTADAFYLEHSPTGNLCEADFSSERMAIVQLGKNRLRIAGCISGGGCITDENLSIKSVEKLDDTSTRVTLLLNLDGQPCKGFFARRIDAVLNVPGPGTYHIRTLVNERFYPQGERLWNEREVRVE
jgi:hypothetical protein